MPKGVICGGAVDGSNQLGEMVTCQAITARSDGTASAGVEAAAQRVARAIGSQTASARWKCRTWNELMGTLQAKIKLLLVLPRSRAASADVRRAQSLPPWLRGQSLVRGME